MAEEKVFPKGLFANEKPAGTMTVIKLDIKVDEFIAFLNQHKNEKGYVKVDLFKNRPDSSSKNTHYAVLNTWKPDSAEKPKAPEVPKVDDFAEPIGDDLPF